jgi:hypothetical protein
MIPITEGKAYFFKTFAHYYLGRVRSLTPTHAIIDEASEVYETGPLSTFFGEGKPKFCERLPDGWAVPLGQTAFGEWGHKLPSRAIGLSNA